MSPLFAVGGDIVKEIPEFILKFLLRIHQNPVENILFLILVHIMCSILCLGMATNCFHYYIELYMQKIRLELFGASSNLISHDFEQVTLKPPQLQVNHCFSDYVPNNTRTNNKHKISSI